MTSLLRRKRPTTAQRTATLRTPVKLALLAVLFGGPVTAQQPPSTPAATPLANGLYAPPGYRPRTPPPQTPPQAPTERAMGGGGRVLYIHKPADALLADEPGNEMLAMASASDPVPSPTSEPNGLLTVPSRPSTTPIMPTPKALPARTVSRTPSEAQPGSPPGATFTVPNTTTTLPQVKTPTVDASVTRLPTRDKIFVMYNDEELAKFIAKSLREEQTQRNVPTPPADDPQWRFPEQTPIVAPGTQYRAKTYTYEHRLARIEPSFVVHRRLHFEEKNAERYGWDLGFAQPLVSTMYFYRDTLLWPASLVSGCIKGPWDTNRGKCDPGSPVPYYLYPPGLTITGTLAEAGLITGLSFIFP